MSDLISRSKLLEEINSLSIVLNGKQIFSDDAKDTVLRIINEQPTAYEIDNVVATMDKALTELEDGTNCGTCVFKEVCDDGYDGCIQTIVAVCKSIVKAGGNIELSEHSESQGNRTGKQKATVAAESKTE